MAIPESQLETWSGQGSITQSAATYGTIKRALEKETTGHFGRDFNVFLQGSYGNDTNIYAESDVDVVIRYNGAFYNDLTRLPPEQQGAFKLVHSDGTYPYNTFKGHVQEALSDAFNGSVKPGKKAVKVEANGSRRNADIVVAFEYRRYFRFNGLSDQSYSKGMCFFNQDGTQIANFPKQHSENCTTKHQATNSNFKPVVRIFKNMRSRLVDNSVIEQGVAPSYYIEGLLYNVPNEYFTGTYQEMVLKILKWLHQTTDRTKFVCANEQYYLLRDNSLVCWPTANGEKFIKAVIKLWNEW